MQNRAAHSSMSSSLPLAAFPQELAPEPLLASQHYGQQSVGYTPPPALASSLSILPVSLSPAPSASGLHQYQEAVLYLFLWRQLKQLHVIRSLLLHISQPHSRRLHFSYKTWILIIVFVWANSDGKQAPSSLILVFPWRASPLAILGVFRCPLLRHLQLRKESAPRQRLQFASCLLSRPRCSTWRWDSRNSCIQAGPCWK